MKGDYMFSGLMDFLKEYNNNEKLRQELEKGDFSSILPLVQAIKPHLDRELREDDNTEKYMCEIVRDLAVNYYHAKKYNLK